jgi:adenylate cyclase
MVATLSSFGSYVPRALVRRLMRAGGPGAVVSEQREVTVMFTDIVGFTALSEHLPAGDVAAFLNQHIAIIDRCVEAEEGTIDKYIGDAVMVFWGAPETQPDQADRACRAAVSIAREIHTENVRRRLHGEPAIRVRIGIHSGPAVVGNVGATTRFNYTIIGDTVNTAERIEVLSRELVDPATEVYAALSAATAERLRQPWTLIPHGPHHIRGREQPIELYGIDVAAD